MCCASGIEVQDALAAETQWWAALLSPPDDVDLLVRIRDLLYRDGYTIKGAQKLLTSGDEGEGRHAVRTAKSHGQLQEALVLLDEAQADIGRIRAVLGGVRVGSSNPVSDSVS